MTRQKLQTWEIIGVEYTQNTQSVKHEWYHEAKDGRKTAEQTDTSLKEKSLLSLSHHQKLKI
jgi:hypothetical protein